MDRRSSSAQNEASFSVMGSIGALLKRDGRTSLSPLWRISAQCAVGGVLLYLFLRQVDWSAAMAAVMRAHLAPIILALLAYAADFLLRAVRFWMLLQAITSRQLPLRQVPAPFIASFGISDLLPLRAGDIFRLAWFRREMRLPAGTVLGAMIIERFYDLASLLLLGVVVMVWQFTPMSAVPILSVAIMAMMVAPIAMGHVAPAFSGSRTMRVHPVMARIGNGWRDMLEAFRILRSFRRGMTLAALSMICWLLEAILFLCAWQSLGGAPSQWVAPMTAFTASTLGTLIPGLPGHFGTFELFGLEAFTRTGVSAEMAAAVLLLAHLMLWAPTALFAILWLPFARGRAASGQAAEQSDGLLPQR